MNELKSKGARNGLVHFKRHPGGEAENISGNFELMFELLCIHFERWEKIARSTDNVSSDV